MPSSNGGGPIPEAALQTRLYDALDGARPGRYGIKSADVSPDGRVWFATGFVVQMVDPTRASQAALPASTYIESVIVDRKELAAIDDLNLPRTLAKCRLITPHRRSRFRKK